MIPARVRAGLENRVTDEDADKFLKNLSNEFCHKLVDMKHKGRVKASNVIVHPLRHQQVWRRAPSLRNLPSSCGCGCLLSTITFLNE